MTTATEPTRASGYRELWRGVPREFGFHLLTLPLSIIGFGLTVSLFSAGLGTIVTFFIGVVLVIVALYASRVAGTIEIARLEWAGRTPIERPEWQQRTPGFWGWLRSTLGNGHYWLYLLHTMVVNFIISVVSWTIYITWLATALGGVTYVIWGPFIPRGNRNWNLSQWILERLGLLTGGVDYYVMDLLVYAGVGVVFLATLPFVSRGLLVMHDLVARGMLAAFASDALRQQVADVTASRGAAISAEGQSLRRLERDIHDGPQQRLVRLQMDLAAAERQLDADPEKARGLITEAMAQSKEALEELRSLSRGFAPPILLDRGLVAALESAADRSPVPVKIVDELAADLPQEIERNAYFVASEALANVAKHSGATEATVRVWTDDEPSLTVAVFDNGRGGASPTAGHGLAGLEERLRGLGGTLDVSSPDGGPTSIVAHLPIPKLDA
jgi:signal transduction histidine kinase